MPQHIALHGVLIPVLAGLALLIGLLLTRWQLDRSARWRPPHQLPAPLAWLRLPMDGTRVLAPPLALVFVLSFHARQGLQWPPPTAWEWMAPAIMVVTAVAWVHPAPSTALVAGIATAWALALPGMKDLSWRIGLGTAVLVVASMMLVMWAGWLRPKPSPDNRPGRVSALLALSSAFAGLAGIIIASGFEKLTTIIAAIAILLALAAGLAWFHRSLAIGAAIIPASMMLVGAAAIAAAYGPDDFPRWHWLVAIAAPLTAIVAEFPPRVWRDRPRLQGVMRVGVVSVVAFANTAAALGPSIARGEFPP